MWAWVLGQLPGLSIGTSVTIIVGIFSFWQTWAVGDPSNPSRSKNPHTYTFSILQTGVLPVLGVEIRCASAVQSVVDGSPVVAGSLQILNSPKEYGVWHGKDQLSFVCDPVVGWLKLSHDLLPLNSRPPTPPTQEEWDAFAREARIRIQIKFWLGPIPLTQEFWFYGRRNAENSFSWRRALSEKALSEIKYNDDSIDYFRPK